MVTFPQNSHLINEGLLVFDVLFLDDFDGSDVVWVLFGLCLIDGTVCAFTEDLR